MSTENLRRQKRVLAVCSGGGHWIQMLRLRPAFADSDVTYATVQGDGVSNLSTGRVVSIPDANRDQKLQLCWLLVRLLWVVLRTQPDVIVSTGAAPGYLAIRIGKLIGAKTLFLDSIANAREPSLSALLASKHADVTLSQWDHVAKDYGIDCWGAVL